MARGMSHVLLLVGLLAVAGCVSAARPEPAVNAGHWATTLESQGLTDFSYADLTAREVESDEKETPFRLLTKFIVRPSISKEFAKGWLKYKKEAEGAKGAKTVSLSKPLSDNILFWGYEEWESKADFFKWVKSEDSAAKLLALYIEEKDIPVVLTQLVNVTPAPHSHHGHHHHHGDHHSGVHAQLDSARESLALESVTDFMADITETVEGQVADISATLSSSGRGMKWASGGDGHKWSPVILTRALVKPSELFRFVAASNLLAKGIAENAKGNKVFVVSKSLDNDSEFYFYSIWESEEALKDYAKESYAKLFRQYVLDHDVFVKTSLLLPIEDEE